jgi:hypothetical protein
VVMGMTSCYRGSTGGRMWAPPMVPVRQSRVGTRSWRRTRGRSRRPDSPGSGFLRRAIHCRSRATYPAPGMSSTRRTAPRRNFARPLRLSPRSGPWPTSSSVTESASRLVERTLTNRLFRITGPQSREMTTPAWAPATSALASAMQAAATSTIPATTVGIPWQWGTLTCLRIPVSHACSGPTFSDTPR